MQSKCPRLWCALVFCRHEKVRVVFHHELFPYDVPCLLLKNLGMVISSAAYNIVAGACMILSMQYVCSMG